MKGRSEDDMVVNFEFLGNEAIENVITCMNFKVDKVIFFGYYETIQSQRKNVDNFLCKYCGVQKTEYHTLSHDDLRSVLKTMRKEIENELKQNNQIYFDITGGESLLLVAFGKLSKEFETPMHLYDVLGNRLIELYEDTAHRISNDVEPQRVQLDLDKYIEMQGGIINQGLHKNIKNDEFVEELAKIWKVAKKNWDYWNSFSDFLRANFVPDENLNVNTRTSTVVSALSESKTKLKNINKFNNIVDELDAVGILLNVERSNEQYRFTFKNQEVKDCLWEGGSILELHVYQKEKTQSDECKVGVHLDWDGEIHNRPGEDVVNEIDVLSLKGNTPTFISCKSGKMGAQQALHALYELQTVADRFGGKYAKKLLVTAHPLGDIYRERAAEMGIEVKGENL